MESETFSIIIKASREIVWDTLWNKDTYSQWTVPFGVGMMTATSWEEGSLVRCLDEMNNGMVTRVTHLRPMEFVLFEPVALVHHGEEDYDSDEVNDWRGAKESYTLTDSGDKTEVLINMHFSARERTAVVKSWPLALQILKKLSEEA